MGLIPIFICIYYAVCGALQLITRKNLLLVDVEIICLGVYYIAVISVFVFFEMFPVNYRPVLINGQLLLCGKKHELLKSISMFLNIFYCIFLALAREPYALLCCFFQLIFKTCLIIQVLKKDV